jgi:hypothetical protein
MTFLRACLQRTLARSWTFQTPRAIAWGSYLPKETVDIAGHTVQFAARVGRADMERSGEDYYPNLQRVVGEERTQLAVVAAAYLLLPPILLPILGGVSK